MLIELRTELQKHAQIAAGSVLGPMGIASGQPISQNLQALSKYWGGGGFGGGRFSKGLGTFAGAHPMATALGGMILAPMAMRLLNNITGGDGRGLFG